MVTSAVNLYRNREKVWGYAKCAEIRLLSGRFDGWWGPRRNVEMECMIASPAKEGSRKTTRT